MHTSSTEKKSIRQAFEKKIHPDFLAGLTFGATVAAPRY
jgi:hypothetical protein